MLRRPTPRTARVRGCTPGPDPRLREPSGGSSGHFGPAQLALPPDSDVHSVRRKLSVDLRYVEHGGLLLDARVLLYTAARIFKLPVHWLDSLTGMNDWLAPPHVESGPPMNGKKVPISTRRPAPDPTSHRHAPSADSLPSANVEKLLHKKPR